MSNEIETGGPAFPVVKYNQPAGVGAHVMTIEGGMNLRDYFAAKALQVCMEFGAEIARAHVVTLDPDELKKTLCGDAYAWADAMLAARESGKSDSQADALNAESRENTGL